MDEVVVRAATPGDVAQLAQLFDAYRVFYGRSADPTGAEGFVQDRLANGDSQVFVAHLGSAPDRLIGFTQLYPSYSSVSMCRIYVLNDLFVDPSARRLGVGRVLIEAAHTFAKEQSAGRVSLATAVTNTGAQQLYESLGISATRPSSTTTGKCRARSGIASR